MVLETGLGQERPEIQGSVTNLRGTVLQINEYKLFTTIRLHEWTEQGELFNIENIVQILTLLEQRQ